MYGLVLIENHMGRNMETEIGDWDYVVAYGVVYVNACINGGNPCFVFAVWSFLLLGPLKMSQADR